MAAFDTPLMIIAVMATGSTFLMFYVEEVYLTVIFGIIGMVTCFSAAGYWLSSMTNIPGIAWLFGGLGLIDIVWSIGMSVMTAFPSVLSRARISVSLWTSFKQGLHHP